MALDTSHSRPRKRLGTRTICDKQKNRGGGICLDIRSKYKGVAMRVSILADLRSFKRTMNKIEKEQFNVIVRNSLLDTGFKTQKILRTQTYQKVFNPRQKQFPKLTTSLGTGQPVKFQSGVTLKKGVERRKEIVIFDRLGKEYMQRHAKGGIKRPISGSSVVVPGRDTVEPRRTSRGIPKRLRPSVLLDQKKVFRTKVGGQEVIARRRGKDRYPIEIMHILEPNARIPKRYNFYEDSANSFRREFPLAFRRNFASRMKRVLKTKY